MKLVSAFLILPAIVLISCNRVQKGNENELVIESSLTDSAHSANEVFSVRVEKDGVGDEWGYEPCGDSDSTSKRNFSFLAPFQFKFSTINKAGYHNICLVVSSITSTPKAELHVIKYSAAGSDKVQSFNLSELSKGVLISLTKSGTDTILNVEAASNNLKYFVEIPVIPSTTCANVGDIDLKLIAYHSYDNGSDKKVGPINQVCIVGMDDARDAGYVSTGVPANLTYGRFRTVGNVGPSVFQIRYVVGGSYGNIRLNSEYSGRMGSSWYDNRYAAPQIAWGCVCP